MFITLELSTHPVGNATCSKTNSYHATVYFQGQAQQFIFCEWNNFQIITPATGEAIKPVAV